MWFTTLQLGIRNLLLHKLRSFLTMLGTILGVGSVIAMLAIGEGSKQAAVEQIRKLGAKNVIIRSVKPDQGGAQQSDTSSGVSSSSQSDVLEYGLKYKDLDRLKATIPTIEDAIPMLVMRKSASHGSRRITNCRVLGIVPEYTKVKTLDVQERGRFINRSDEMATRNVAVLTAGAAQQLFSYKDPLNKDFLLGDGAYKVIGVLDTMDSGAARAGAIGAANQNNDILIPLTTAHRRFGEIQIIQKGGDRDYEKTQLSEITLMVKDESLVSQTAEMARKILSLGHPNGNDYEVQVPLELMRQAEKEKRIWNIVLGSIAGISLLVGGIGIMNIMLATVTERTREIGIRRALGAKRGDIILQFLVETVVLSSAGGLLGVFVGVAIPWIVSAASNIRTAVSLWSILLAFGIAVLTGIIFGLYPARRAALMDPIEALRHQ